MVQAVRATAVQQEVYLVAPGNVRVTSVQLEAYGPVADRPVRVTAMQLEVYYAVNPDGSTPFRRKAMPDAILCR